MSVTGEIFRDVFQRWPSGVAVATSVENGHAHGMIVGSFCSLSVDPPLVMMSAGTSTRLHDMIDHQGQFAISILGDHQRGIVDRFAGFDRSYDADRFAGLRTEIAVTGMPVIPEALGWVDCQVVARHPGNGYTIFVAEVLAASLGEGSEDLPMVYFRRTPHTLTAGDWQI